MLANQRNYRFLWHLLVYIRYVLTLSLDHCANIFIFLLRMTYMLKIPSHILQKSELHFATEEIQWKLISP